VSKLWYTVDAPWGDGSWIVEGDPDPHKGKFIADCESLAFSAGEDPDYYGGAGDPAANASLIVAEHNAALAGGDEEALLSVKFQLEELSLKQSRLWQAWQRTARQLAAMAGVDPELLPNRIAALVRQMRDFDAAPEGYDGDTLLREC
jgi:hypothetical protein